MISDVLANWRLYFTGPAWQKAFGYLEGLSADSAEGEFHLDGERMFARVMSHDTVSPGDGDIEAHRVYIDVHMALNNAEGVEWFRQPDLKVRSPYNPENDAELYEAPEAPAGRLDLNPGTFAVFFPEDAHIPQLTIGGKPRTVKKVVVKIAMELVKDGKT